MKTKLLILVLVAVAILIGQSLAVSSGTKSVAKAGTAVRIIADNTPFKSGVLQGAHGNSGRVCFGGSNVSAASNIGTCLAADGTASIYPYSPIPYDLSNFWIDADSDSNAIVWTIYVQQ